MHGSCRRLKFLPWAPRNSYDIAKHSEVSGGYSLLDLLFLSILAMFFLYMQFCALNFVI